MNFALIGAAGYIAPRHMQAIKANGHRLEAAIDPSDSVGIIDGHFPDAQFFTEFERFDRHLDKLRRRQPESAVQYVSICSPNYLHDAHIRFALRTGADAICEKPLVLNPWNLDALEEMERETGHRVWTILQLRHHPAILALREEVRSMPATAVHEVAVSYVTSRGPWYLQSWKGDLKKSGGIATNIGVHFFDVLHFVFGALQQNIVHMSTDTKAAGYLEYDNARVKWFLSVDIDDIPTAIRDQGQRTYRSITVDGRDIELSDGFADLHTVSYRAILNGQGFGLPDNRCAIETVAAIRRAPIEPDRAMAHPLLLERAR
jgi:UDP-N-acetyl-2-amino-2-deoxyglucuronate dehydrogenase